VVGVVALALGASGAGLWNSLSKGHERAKDLEDRVIKLQREADDVDEAVAEAAAKARKAEEENLRRVGEEERDRLSRLPDNLEKRLAAIGSRIDAIESKSVGNGDTIFLRTWRNNYLTAPDGGAVQNGVVRSNSSNQGKDEQFVVLKGQ
jgi:hypothetical protein